MQLHEQYRPRKWSEVIGHERVLQRIKRVAKRGWGGRAWWISGQSGIGKTTIAYLLAAEVADKHFVHELDATSLNVSALRELERDMHFYGLGKGGRAYIINEAHGLRADVIRQLLVLLERLPSHVMVIFTTTRDGQEELFEDHHDAHPLLSRCVCLKLVRQGLTPAFAKHAKRIAKKEGLDGKPIRDYQYAIRRRRGNLRELLTDIEQGVMLG